MLFPLIGCKHSGASNKVGLFVKHFPCDWLNRSPVTALYWFKCLTFFFKGGGIRQRVLASGPVGQWAVKGTIIVAFIGCFSFKTVRLKKSVALWTKGDFHHQFHESHAFVKSPSLHLSRRHFAISWSGGWNSKGSCPTKKDISKRSENKTNVKNQINPLTEWKRLKEVTIKSFFWNNYQWLLPRLNFAFCCVCLLPNCCSLVGLTPSRNPARLQQPCLFANASLTIPLAGWINDVVDVPKWHWRGAERPPKWGCPTSKVEAPSMCLWFDGQGSPLGPEQI